MLILVYISSWKPANYYKFRHGRAISAADGSLSLLASLLNAVEIQSESAPV